MQCTSAEVTKQSTGTHHDHKTVAMVTDWRKIVRDGVMAEPKQKLTSFANTKPVTSLYVQSDSSETPRELCSRSLQLKPALTICSKCWHRIGTFNCYYITNSKVASADILTHACMQSATHGAVLAPVQQGNQILLKSAHTRTDTVIHTSG